MSKATSPRIAVDSRLVRPGDTFVATRTEGSYFYRGDEDTSENKPYGFDSHPYIPDAIQRGAGLIVYSDPNHAPETDLVQLLRVDDGIQYLVELVNQAIEITAKTVIGVTGSTGKSTTSELVARAVGVEKTFKHLSNRPTPISIPLLALNSPRFSKAEYYVVEMPMDGLGQITELCQVTPPDIGVIININDSHVHQLGSLHNIVIAKMELAWQARANRGFVVLNGDDPNLALQVRNLTRRRFDLMTFGASVSNDIRIISTRRVGAGFEYTLGYKGVIKSVRTGYVGDSIAYLVAAAVAAARCGGIEFGQAMDNLDGVRPLPGRMSVLEGKKGELILDDTRLATPQDTLALLRLALSIPVARRILIQGPVLRDYQHGPVGNKVLELMNSFDRVALYRDASWIPFSHDFDVLGHDDDLASWYSRFVQPEDLVVFNGSEGVRMWEILPHFVVPSQVGMVYNSDSHE